MIRVLNPAMHQGEDLLSELIGVLFHSPNADRLGALLLIFKVVLPIWETGAQLGNALLLLGLMPLGVLVLSLTWQARKECQNRHLNLPGSGGGAGHSVSGNSTKGLEFRLPTTLPDLVDL